ncbi:immunoglobulin-like domain-containing protein [Listeria rustica]|uniref:Bacterial Ig domain-containing protein n=1 Tax=Listeria rustica TaxID=2713503 RepID=A0A7W1T8S9_9LIST|nr:immunoglobulin-like domain-containing protein [Listeria rustica]MBA3927520.1 hypothetical protein [Listeria rustica]
MKSHFKKGTLIFAIFVLIMSSILPTLQPLAATENITITITQLSNDSQTVTGNGAPNGVVTILDKKSDTLGYGKTDATGKFSIQVSRALIYNEKIIIYISVNGKNEMSESLVTDDLAPKAPRLEGTETTHLDATLDITSLDYEKAIGNLVTAIVGGKKYETTLGAFGRATITLTTQAKIGDKIEITETNRHNGKVSPPTISYVTDGTPIYPALNFTKLITDETTQVTVECPIPVEYGERTIALVLSNGIILTKKVTLSYYRIKETFTIPPQPDGAKLTTYLIAPSGFNSVENSTYVTSSKIAIQLDYLDTTKQTITGNYTGEARAILDVNGTQYPNESKTKGQFSFAINEKIRSSLIKASVKLYNTSGYLAATQKVKPAIFQPVVLMPKENTITGRFDGELDYINLLVNGTETQNIYPDGSTFNYYIGNARYTSADDIIIQGYSDGRIVDKTKLAIMPNTAGSITIDGYTSSDTEITGSWKGDVATVAAMSYSNFISDKVKVDKNGHFLLTLDDYYKNTMYYIIAYDQYGHVLSKVRAIPSSNTIQADTYFIGKNQVTGLVKGDIKYVRLTVNSTYDVAYEFLPVNSDGTFSIPSSEIYSNTDVVFITGYNSNKDEVAKKQLFIRNETAEVDSFAINDSYITGSYTGAITAVNIVVNGQQYKNGSFSNGTFKFYAKDKKIKKDDKVFVQLFTGDTQVYESAVKITDPLKATITPFNIVTDRNILATYQNATVTRVSLLVDGITYNGGTVANGKVTFYALDKISKTSKNVTMLFYNTTNQLLLEQNISVINEPFVAAVNTFKLGDKNIIAIYKNSTVAKVSLVVDGTTYNGGTIANGAVTFYALDKIQSANESAIMYFYDGQDRLLGKQMVIFERSPFVANVTAFKLGDKNILATYKNRKVGRVSLTVDGVVYNGGTISDASITYYALDKIKASSKDISMQFYDPNDKLLLAQQITITK